MANYDGDVTLHIGMEAGDLLDVSREIQDELKNIFSNTSEVTLSENFQKLQLRALNLYNKISKLRPKLEELGRTEIPTEAFSALENEATTLQEKINAVRQETQNALKEGASEYYLKSKIEEYNQLVAKLNEVNAKMQEMRDSGTAFISGDTTAEFKNLQDQLTETAMKAELAKNQLLKLLNPEVKPSYAEYSKLHSILDGINLSALSTAKRLLQIGGSGILNGIKRLAKSMGQLNKHTRSNNNALAMGFKKFVQFGLGIRTVFLLVKRLRQALIDGFGNIAQYSSEFNGLVSAFVSALATLKNSFATAFAPIATVALPLLTALMNALVRVMNIIGQFFAAITGKGTFIQAKAVQKDYAASLKKTGSSGGSAAKGLGKAKDAAEELKKTIAGFDDVEILHEDKDSDSSSGSGGGGGGGAGLGDLDPLNMYETVDIESPIKDLASRLREAIASQNWEELGSILAEGINGIFTKANQLISWDNVGEKITFIINAITTTFNSLVDHIDWELIGLTLANGINTLVNTVYLLITGVDWENLGKSWVEGLNSFIGNIDFELVGETISAGINAIIDLLYGQWSNFDWGNFAKQLMTGLNSAIRNVNWKKLGQTVQELFNGVLEFFTSVLRNFDWAGLGTAIGEFLAGIDWWKVFMSIVGAIIELQFDLTTALYQVVLGIFKEVIKGIIEFFGGDEGAVAIVDGLFNGILNAMSNIKQYIQETIFDPFINTFKSIFEIGSPSKVMERLGSDIIDGLKNGISNTWKNIKEFFTGKADEITKDFKKANWKGAGNGAVTALKDGVKNKWSEIVTSIGSGSDEAAEKITKTDWRSKGNTVSSEVQAGIVNRWSQITTFINTSVANLGRIITNFNWSNVGSTISNTIKSGLSSAWSSITSFVNNNVGSIKNAFNNTNWKSIGENICKGVKEGMSDNAWRIMNEAKSLASNALDTMMSKLKINSPSKVFRDVIGQAIPEGIAVGIDKNASLALNSVQNLADSLTDTQLPELEMPPIAMGEIIPYETSKTMENLTSSIKNLMDVLQYQQSNAITRDELISVLNSVLPSMLQQYISFYIGDEEVARHANLGNEMLAQRFNPVGI